MVRGYGFRPPPGGHRLQGWARRGMADNGGMESALLEQLVAAGGPVAQSCLRWVAFGESRMPRGGVAGPADAAVTYDYLTGPRRRAVKRC